MPPAAEQLSARFLAGPALRAQPDRRLVRLVRLVREGYESAFEEIVRRYRRPLDRFAAAIVGPRSEDVTQDAFSKALLALRGSEAEIELRPWLYRIVRNTALNDLRDGPPPSEELAEAALNQACRDQDRDQLRNRAEFLAGDNPRKADSDGDGIDDGEEQAGTIDSFDPESGRLAIDLFGGDTLGGLVTADTRIKCEGAEEHHHRHRGRGREERSGGPGPSSDNGGSEAGGDNSGRGEEEPGDDRGGQGEEEPGDDNGGEESAGCGTAALAAGAVVQEAELHVVGGKAVFEEVELAHRSPPLDVRSIC
jgi:Sigma-70 region 2